MGGLKCQVVGRSVKVMKEGQIGRSNRFCLVLAWIALTEFNTINESINE